MWLYWTIKVITLAKVVVVFKIFPEGVEVNLNKLKKRIQSSLPTNVSIHKFEEEPIAFGLVAIIAYVLLPEENGKIDLVEDSIKAVKGVSEIETIMVRRV
jgi:elongation factor 1-beta